MATADAQVESSGLEVVSRLLHKPAVWALIATIAAAGVGLWIGSRRTGVAELTGQASVGHHMATIESDGWFYGVRESVAWIDADGSFHDDGWPACLGTRGSTRTVRFAAVPVTVSDTGAGYRDVVYIDCRVQ
jgi:hypothetical protein